MKSVTARQTFENQRENNSSTYEAVATRQRYLIDYSPEDKEWFAKHLSKKYFEYLFGISDDI